MVWVLLLSSLTSVKANAQQQPTAFVIAPRSCSAPDSAAAKTQAQKGSPGLVHQIGMDFENVFRRKENLIIVALGLGAAWGASYFDDQIVSSNFNSEAHEGNSYDRVFESGEFLGGGLVQIGGAFATYGLGKLLSKPEVEKLGSYLVRAQMVTVPLTFGLKFAVSRERPDSTSNRSFPSGHASVTFASATVLQRLYGWKAGVPAYLVASYVATSRLNENKHYLSDIVFGAALGVMTGRTVTIDIAKGAFTLNPMLTPGGLSVRLARRAYSRKN